MYIFKLRIDGNFRGRLFFSIWEEHGPNEILLSHFAYESLSQKVVYFVQTLIPHVFIYLTRVIFYPLIIPYYLFFVDTPFGGHLSFVDSYCDQLYFMLISSNQNIPLLDGYLFIRANFNLNVGVRIEQVLLYM